MKTTSFQFAGSGDSLNFVFSFGGENISSVDVTNNGRWDVSNQSSTYDFGVLDPWDTVSITQGGTDGINFEEFLISCDNGRSIDFVKLGNCSSLWIDKYDGDKYDDRNSDCYEETANHIKVGLLGNYLHRSGACTTVVESKA